MGLDSFSFLTPYVQRCCLGNTDFDWLTFSWLQCPFHVYRCRQQQVQYFQLHVGFRPHAVSRYFKNPSDYPKLCGLQTRSTHRPARWGDGHHRSLQTHWPNPQRDGESHSGRNSHCFSSLLLFGSGFIWTKFMALMEYSWWENVWQLSAS